jgi:hypothetical protein
MLKSDRILRPIKFFLMKGIIAVVFGFSDVSYPLLDYAYCL